MIETLEITNFKSVKHLTLPCKRFNVFIGEPNTGKSNILEALGLLSFIGAWQYQPGIKLDGFVRHERTSNLFYDEEVGEGLKVRCDGLFLEAGYAAGTFNGYLFLKRGEVTVAPVNVVGEHRTITGVDYVVGSMAMFNNPASIGIPDVEGEEVVAPWHIKFYRSTSVKDFVEVASNVLLPPFGQNLPTLLLQNRELRNAVNSPFLSSGLRLGLRPQENKIELVKHFEDIITSYPYSLVSDTWQRMTFYTAALMTNRDSVLIFEEPEAHSFPNETKLLAEQIALDENNNQFFIVTHNPYFLMPLLSKAPKDEISINIVRQEEGEYQTKVRPLAEEELPELFQFNIFANLDRYLEDD